MLFNTKNESNKFLLILTPSFTGGSWNMFYRFIKFYKKNYPETSISIVGSGKIDKRLENLGNLSSLGIKWFDYNKYVHKLERSPILNIIFNLPLLILITVYIIINFSRISVIMSNGLLSLFPAIFIKYISKRNIGLFPWLHVDLRLSESKLIKKVVKSCSKFINAFFVNSEDTKEDLIKCGVGRKKVVVVNNWIDYIKLPSDKIQKFKDKYRFLNSYKFIVLYVGRFVHYKHFPLYLKVAEKLASEEIAFIFVGDGELYYMVQEATSKNNNIFVLRGIPDDELRYLYSIANITLTYADETYLSLTALESLSMGTPIVYADISVSPSKYYKKIKIRRELVPKAIGFKVEACVYEIGRLIKSLKDANFPTHNIRAKCMEYIKLNHSERNAEILSNILSIRGNRNDKNR